MLPHKQPNTVPDTEHVLNSSHYIIINTNPEESREDSEFKYDIPGLESIPE